MFVTTCKLVDLIHLFWKPDSSLALWMLFTDMKIIAFVKEIKMIPLVSMLCKITCTWSRLNNKVMSRVSILQEDLCTNYQTTLILTLIEECNEDEWKETNKECNKSIDVEKCKRA